jgi:predicted MPP superfamily phosphohydrolase
MKLSKVSRRRFLAALLLGAPALAAADALWIEPRWIKIRKVRLVRGKPAHRLVHFTDLHHKGDRKFLQRVIRKINGLSPEFICFTGDIVEDARFLGEALDGLRQIKAPSYGVPGNHDYWSHADFEVIARAFAATGGKWLMDESVLAAGGEVNIVGASCTKPPQPKLQPGVKNILLIHYPDWIDNLAGYKFDLVLAGHSHGEQVRLPFFGPLVHTFGAERHNLGLYQTPSGPLYVGAGIGWFYLPVRFNCRPEIAVIEI